MEYIQLKQDNILRFGIKDSEGNDTGNILEFDMEDIELPFRLNDCAKKHKENLQKLKAQFVVLDKKQDVDNGEIMTENQKQKLKALEEFYKSEEEAIDLFLGEGGTKKMLNGRKPYYSMYDDIDEMLQPILPMLTKQVNDIESKIKEKYKTKEEEDVL